MPADPTPLRVACFATQGPDSGDERRIQELLSPLDPTVWEFERSPRLRGAARIVRHALRERPDLIVMEGTGVGGGAAVMAARLALGVPFVVSSGDAIGPFFATHSWWAAIVGSAYERALCRLCAGYVAWTPYLAGRALTLGAPRATTAAGWASRATGAGREETRARIGIPADALVFGIVGSLVWSARRGYCYGLELVHAAARVQREGVHVLIVGDGDGMRHLVAAAKQARVPVHLQGHVSPSEVPAHLAAMDVASLPQSTDRLGVFRYSTKLPEYLAAKLPVVTGELPVAYDLDRGWLWRLPGMAPWDDEYIAALAALMENVDGDEVARRRAAVPQSLPTFDREAQQTRVTAFIRETVARERSA